jgi:hypothetical protein
MSATPIVIQGTVKPDGTLELEGKVPLPAGKVSVTLQPIPEWPEGNPFFEMVKGIWAAHAHGGPPSRTGEEAQAALRRLHDEFDEEVAEVGRLQEECRRLRLSAEAAEKEAG